MPVSLVHSAAFFCSCITDHTAAFVGQGAGRVRLKDVVCKLYRLALNKL